MDAITTIIVAVLGTWIAAVGSGMVVVMWKLNTTTTKLISSMERHEERLDGHDERLQEHSDHLFKKGCKVLLLMALLLFLPSCSLLGLDMEQAQADAEETASALEIVANQADAVAQEIVRLEEVWKNAESSNDIERMREVWPQLQSSYQLAKLKKVELKEIQVVFNNRVEQFKEAKDTKGYLQAALGLLGGVAAVFFPGLAAIKRRNKLIDVALPKKSGDALSNRQQALLDKIRKA